MLPLLAAPLEVATWPRRLAKLAVLALAPVLARSAAAHTPRHAFCGTAMTEAPYPGREAGKRVAVAVAARPSKPMQQRGLIVLFLTLGIGVLLLTAPPLLQPAGEYKAMGVA